MSYGIGKIVSAIIVFIASFFLSMLALKNGFGSPAFLIIPTSCVGFFFSLVLVRSSDRIGWFTFATVLAFLLPFAGVAEQGLHSVFGWCEDYLRDSRLKWFYNVVEVAAIFGGVILPWLLACFLGRYASRFVQKMFCSPVLPGDANRVQSDEKYRFSIRGLMVAVMVCCALTAWLSNTVRQWHVREAAKTSEFVEKFKRSFTSGATTLIGEPFVEANRSSHFDIYRVYAQIKKTNSSGKEEKLWAVWAYWCDECYPGTVSNFGYAEDSDALNLPKLLAAKHLYGLSSSMVDGAPPTGMVAPIASAPSAVVAGEKFRIAGKTDRYLMCDLVIRPAKAVSALIPTANSGVDGNVYWDVKINPGFSGSTIEYEIQTSPGKLYRAEVVTGSINIAAAENDQ